MKNNYKEMTIVELNNSLQDFLKEKYDLCNKLKLGKLSNHAKIRTIKKNIAMIKTEISRILNSEKIKNIEK